jgi:hypothetical protein
MEDVPRTVPLSLPRTMFSYGVIMENMKFRNINFCNRGIKRWQNMSIQSPGMLLFPLGNLSHTSILYYVIFYGTEVFE